MSAALKVVVTVCTSVPSRETMVVTVSPALASLASVTRRSTPLAALPSSTGLSATLSALGATVSTVNASVGLATLWLPAESVSV